MSPQRLTPDQKKAAASSVKSTKVKKRQPKGLYVLFGGLVLAYMLYLGFKPFEGTIKFGICKIFIEQSVFYPDEIHYMSVEEGATTARIEYTMMNPFGETTYNVIQCSFRTDPVTQYALTEVTMNRDVVEPEKLDAFNIGIPAIIAHPPSLVLPPAMSKELIDLRH